MYNSDSHLVVAASSSSSSDLDMMVSILCRTEADAAEFMNEHFLDQLGLSASEADIDSFGSMTEIRKIYNEFSRLRNAGYYVLPIRRALFERIKGDGTYTICLAKSGDGGFPAFVDVSSSDPLSGTALGLEKLCARLGI